MLERIKCPECKRHFYADNTADIIECTMCKNEIKKSELNYQEEQDVKLFNIKLFGEESKTFKKEVREDARKSYEAAYSGHVKTRYDSESATINLSFDESTTNKVIQLKIFTKDNKEVLSSYIKTKDFDVDDEFCFDLDMIDAFISKMKKYTFIVHFRVSTNKINGGYPDKQTFEPWMKANDLIINLTNDNVKSRNVAETDKNLDKSEESSFHSTMELLRGLAALCGLAVGLIVLLGIGRASIKSMTPDTIGVRVGYTDENQYMITSVDNKSPAYKSGMQVGDAIIAIDQQIIQSESDIKEALANHEKGNVFDYIIERDGEQINITMYPE